MRHSARLTPGGSVRVTAATFRGRPLLALGEDQAWVIDALWRFEARFGLLATDVRLNEHSLSFCVVVGPGGLSVPLRWLLSVSGREWKSRHRNADPLWERRRPRFSTSAVGVPVPAAVQ